MTATSGVHKADSTGCCGPEAAITRGETDLRRILALLAVLALLASLTSVFSPRAFGNSSSAACGSTDPAGNWQTDDTLDGVDTDVAGAASSGNDGSWTNGATFDLTLDGLGDATFCFTEEDDEVEEEEDDEVEEEEDDEVEEEEDEDNDEGDEEEDEEEEEDDEGDDADDEDNDEGDDADDEDNDEGDDADDEDNDEDNDADDEDAEQPKPTTTTSSTTTTTTPSSTTTTTTAAPTTAASQDAWSATTPTTPGSYGTTTTSATNSAVVGGSAPANDASQVDGLGGGVAEGGMTDGSSPEADRHITLAVPMIGGPGDPPTSGDVPIPPDAAPEVIGSTGQWLTPEDLAILGALITAIAVVMGRRRIRRLLGKAYWVKR